ncbi:hypothetical protein RHSIM_RhsimUnG0176200 [Rhododendron simsii]|uniref:Legume lectin domain-containing protein n=1 Tax=Rhododendron simsii TaxID=118357 RepID=A0A834L2B2_RHOSS|nr:hypothetical protein RHSIM_RhsimUnG0176200 [Rhododendron simsii]
MFSKSGNSELLRLALCARAKVAYLISVTSSEANRLVGMCDLNLYLPLELEGLVRVRSGAGDVDNNPDEAHISTQGLQITSTEWNVNGGLHVGRATYIEPLHLWDKSTQKLADFNTHFVFVLDSRESLKFTDGFTFFLAPDGWNPMAGCAMGLPIDNPYSTTPTSRFVAVEFDTWRNPGDRIKLTTHVGIDVNSVIPDVKNVWYYNITHGMQNEAWIRYDSSSHTLRAVFTGSIGNTRVDDTILFNVDLREHLPERVNIGFSAATAVGNFETHIVKSWKFCSSLEIDETDNILLQLKNM